MGVVYEAEQLHPRRAVAVKMVLEGMDTKEVLARFDGEKEAGSSSLSTAGTVFVWSYWSSSIDNSRL